MVTTNQKPINRYTHKERNPDITLKIAITWQGKREQKKIKGTKENYGNNPKQLTK